MQQLQGSIYDYPKYYDLVYGSDWKAEVEFLEFCFVNYAQRPVTRLFEPACGTGRLLFRLGQRGFYADGIDLNPKAIDFCNKRLERYGLPSRAKVADMCDFELKRPADAAFNTINSFRHLETDEQAVAHLTCVRDNLDEGGIYILGLHLTPTAEAECLSESWSSRRGSLAVNTQMWLIEADKKKRLETFRIKFEIYKPTGFSVIENDLRFRTYSHKQIADLIRRVGGLEIAGCFDFSYDYDYPVELNSETEDAVLILSKTR